jgi:RNA polymerase sigma-70 factor (ECF subfamily)
MSSGPNTAISSSADPEAGSTRRREPAAAADARELLRRGYRFALSLTHDRPRAEDLLQDAWVALLRAGGPRSVAYLITAIRSRFVDQQRRSLIAPTESLDSRPRLADEIEAGFWREAGNGAIARATLERALALLRPEERAVLVLSAVEGYTAREIGELLDAPRGTVLSLMHRTRAKMRRWLSERPETEDRR